MNGDAGMNEEARVADLESAHGQHELAWKVVDVERERDMLALRVIELSNELDQLRHRLEGLEK